MSDDPFASRVADYDAWYDSREGREIFRVEADCLVPLVSSCAPPRLEVGVGTGRFAQALGLEVGVDRALAPLALARARGLRVIAGDAHALPLGESCVGAVVFVMTWCFLTHPRRALAEARRVLRPDGRLVIGTVPLDSPWGEAYARAGREGHPFYRHAHLRSQRDLVATLESEGWEIRASRSALCDAPGTSPHSGPRDGLVEGAGFVALAARPRGAGREGE